MATGTGPAGILARRPATKRTADAGPGGIEAFLLLHLRVHNNRGWVAVIRSGAHARYYDAGWVRRLVPGALRYSARSAFMQDAGPTGLKASCTSTSSLYPEATASELIVRMPGNQS